ncbi:MAG: hypothetical protein K0Q75_28 [Anaerospora sp.]|jgi:hypothetical protein|nr:hypothetical protein [Anaerospora sp.]
MLYIVYGIVLLANSLFSFGKMHSKIIAYFTLLFIWILFWGNTSNADMDSYIRDYTYLQNGSSIDLYGTEPGFLLLMKLSIYLGFNYTTFLAILSAICYFLIHRTVKQYTKNFNYVYLLYLFHPVFLDIVQLRNFITVSILVFAIPLLVEGTTKSKLKYLLLIAVASTVQNIAVLYAPFMLIGKSEKNKIVKYVAYFALCSSILIFIDGQEITFISEFVSIFTDNLRINRYLSGSGQLGFLIAWGIHIIYFTLIYWSRKIINKNTVEQKNINQSKNNKIIAFIDIIFWINVFAFAFFPLYMMNMAFYRIIRNLILLNAIVFSIASDSFPSGGKIQKLGFNFAVLLGSLIWFFYDILGDHFTTVFQPILENNIFF